MRDRRCLSDGVVQVSLFRLSIEAFSFRSF